MRLDTTSAAITLHPEAASLQTQREAFEVLSEIANLPENQWAITGKNPDTHLADLQPPWQ
jgi:hypothetical protein